jgi:hypothetical protein
MRVYSGNIYTRPLNTIAIAIAVAVAKGEEVVVVTIGGTAAHPWSDKVSTTIMTELTNVLERFDRRTFRNEGSM